MSDRTYTRKKFTLLLRKLTVQHNLLFASVSQNAGQIKNAKATSQCILNQQIPMVLYESNNSNPNISLHILQSIDSQQIEIGHITFDMRNEKILKPLSKQYFSKQMTNKSGYAQYKFIAMQTKPVTQQQFKTQTKNKNDLIIRINQNKNNQDQINSMIQLINQKDQIIGKMEVEIQRLIKQTKKLNKSLSKEKNSAAQLMQKNISLNVKLNPSAVSLHKSIKVNSHDWEKQRDQYQYEIQRLTRKIRDYQSRQKQYKQQYDNLRKKIEIDAKGNQKRISDLRKQIQQRYEKQQNKQKRFSTQQKQSQIDHKAQREKKNRYIQQQLTEQLRKIQVQKERQFKKQNLQKQLKSELQRQLRKEKERQKQKQKQRQAQKIKQRQRQRSRSYLRQSSVQHRQFIRQINQLQDQKQALRQKLQIKDQQLHQIIAKLQKAQKQIGKLEDQNIQLRKTKSNLLKEADGRSSKADIQKMKSSFDRQPIQQYEKMIIKERKLIVDQKLRAEMDQLKAKIKRDQRQYKQKLQEKDMQIMKLQLSEKSANRQKDIYSSRIQQIMNNVQGDRKSFLQALQNAHKYQSQQARTKQLEIANNQLQANNYKLTKQKQQIQNTMKKLKSKLDQRQGQWVRLKSIEAQHDYYKTQCQKFQKAYKKFQKQYESIKQYCQNLEHLVGKKPRKTFDQQINLQRQQKHKNQIRNRLQVLIQQVKQMQNKFYLQQIQIWLTQKTNIVAYYAKKFQDDKARILQMQNIKQQAKNTLLQTKQKQINQLKDNQINDVDRKIAKLKLLIRAQDQKSIPLQKLNFEQTINQLTQRIQKAKLQNQGSKKQTTSLKQKITKLQTQLKQKKDKIAQYQAEIPQKKSLSLIVQQRDKPQQLRRSYLQQFKKSRDSYMNKPFQQLKKLNAELQAQKRKIEVDLNQIKFNFDKQRVQLNDKIRTKQREVKKLQNQVSTHQKMNAKYAGDIQNMKKTKQQLQGLIKRMRQQIKQVTKTLQLKQRQCSEALNQIKRMQKNLTAYEQAQKKMFQDVKKMKQKLQKKQVQMQALMQQRNQKAKQIDIQRVSQISKLTQKVKQLQFKLQRQITQNLSVKSQYQKISQIVTQYQTKLKDKQQQYQVLDEAFNIFKTQQGQKIAEYEQQNNILQNHVMQIANQMQKKQGQCYQLQIKIQYCQKRQQVLKTIKNQLQQQTKQLKNTIQQITNQKNKLIDKVDQQINSLDMIKQKAEIYIKQNSKLMVTIKQLQSQVKNHEKQMHQMQKQLLRYQYQRKNLQTEIHYIKQGNNQKIKKLQSALEQKQAQIQKMQKQKSRVTFDDKERDKDKDKGRKSSQAVQLMPNSPVSPMIQRKLLNTSIQRSSSLAYQKSSRSIHASNLNRKQSTKQQHPQHQVQHHQAQPQQQQQDQLFFSKQGIQLNVLKPARTERTGANQQNLNKSKIPNKKQLAQCSKVDIDLQSQQDNPHASNIQSVVMKSVISPIKIQMNQQQKPQVSIMKSQKPSQLKRNFTQQDQLQQQDNISPQQQQQQQQQENANYQQLIHQNQQLKSKVQQFVHQIQNLTNQRDVYLEQLANLKHFSEKDSNPASFIQTKQEQEKFKGFLTKTIQQDLLRKTENRMSPSLRSVAQIPNQHSDKSLVRKLNQAQKQSQQLKNKLIQYQLATTQNQNHIKQLQQQLQAQQNGRQKLVAQMNDILKNLQDEVTNNKNLKNKMDGMQQALLQKISQLQTQIQKIIQQSLKKDEALHETMSTIQKMNKQIKDQQNISQSLQMQVINLNQNIQKLNKIINKNKAQYRKYQQQAQLQILKLKEKVDQLVQQLQIKQQNVNQLAQRYMKLQQKIQLLNVQIKNKEKQLANQKSRTKQAANRRDQALQQMKKFDTSKNGLMNRVGQLQVKLGQKNQQLKQLTKQSAIAYKKYQIQIDTQKQQHNLTKKKCKQREQHISNLKIQIANYNDICHGLQKQKNILSLDITKLQKQLKDIMKCYQQQLDQLHKDKLALGKQLQSSGLLQKQNQIKIQSLNKEIGKRGREIKQLTYKLEEASNNVDKIKQRNRKQVSQLLSRMEVRNDQFEKMKVQMERQTQHYFAKECQFLADKQNRQKSQKQYNQKLLQYQKILQQLQQQLKQLQTRPSSQQWQQICFQNQLYKNRIQQIQQLARHNDQQHQDKLIAQFKQYKQIKQKQMQDLQAEMQKYGFKLHSLQENNFMLKKDNDSMKVQLRNLLQEKMRMQKNVKQYQEDIKELKEQLAFYKAKRIDDLNKLLNQTVD